MELRLFFFLRLHSSKFNRKTVVELANACAQNESSLKLLTEVLFTLNLNDLLTKLK